MDLSSNGKMIGASISRELPYLFWEVY